MTDVATLTKELVEIPSHEDETATGDHIERWLREETNGTVERDRHGNVIARKGGGESSGDDETTSLALVGHHDVVPPDESQFEDGGYVVEQRDGRIYGRGAADMKGAVAAAMCAFRDADVAGYELVFVSYVGEELGGTGARGAIEDGFVPDYAIVGEGSTNYSKPGVTDVVIAHRGRRGSTIHAAGAAAHASEPEAGENAIYRATDAIDVVRDLPFPETTVLGHEMSGSVAVTEIEGGTAWNVIPETCAVTVDERTVPGERAPLERVEDVPGVTLEIEQDLPPMACDEEGFADLVLDAATAVQDVTPEHVLKPHATDAGWLAEAGTTCVVCGAAEPGEAHTADESASVAVLERCYDIYRRCAEQFEAGR